MNTGVYECCKTIDIKCERRKGARAGCKAREKAKVRCEYRDLKQDQMAAVTEAPGQGDERTVVGRQDEETQEHEETATANIVLDDIVAALGDRTLGRARRTTVERGMRMLNPQCVRYIP